MIESMRPTQQEPALLRNILFGDCSEHGGPGFGSQQIVAISGKTRVSTSKPTEISLRRGLIQQLEIHIIGQCYPQICTDPSKVLDQAVCVRTRNWRSRSPTPRYRSRAVARGIGKLCNLSDQFTDELRKLLQRDAVHHFKIDRQIVPQRRKLGRRPGRIFTDCLLNAPKPQLSSSANHCT